MVLPASVSAWHIVGLLAALTLAIYVGYRAGSQCNHEWEDRGWDDFEITISTFDDDPHYFNSIERGMNQKCTVCGRERLDYREIGRVKQSSSTSSPNAGDIHYLLQLGDASWSKTDEEIEPGEFSKQFRIDEDGLSE
jgi:hypothetical protein